MIFYSESENTVRIQCTFTDSDEALIDVDDLEVRIFDRTKNLLETIDTVTRESEGVYYALYETPASTGVVNYYCSFAGTVNGNVVIKRDKFQTRFWVDDGTT